MKAISTTAKIGLIGLAFAISLALSLFLSSRNFAKITAAQSGGNTAAHRNPGISSSSSSNRESTAVERLLLDSKNLGKGFGFLMKPLFHQQIHESLAACSLDDARRVSYQLLRNVEWEDLARTLEDITSARSDLAPELLQKVARDFPNDTRPLCSVISGWALSDPLACKAALASVRPASRSGAIAAYLTARSKVDPIATLVEAKHGIAGTSPSDCASTVLIEWLHSDATAATRQIESEKIELGANVWSELFYQKSKNGETFADTLRVLRSAPCLAKWQGLSSALAHQLDLPGGIDTTLAVLENEFPAELKEESKRSLLAGYAYREPAVLPKILATLTAGKASDELISSAMTTMGKACPEVAVKWLESEAAGPQSATKAIFYESLVSGWLSKAPDQVVGSIMTSNNSTMINALMGKLTQNALDPSVLTSAMKSLPPDIRVNFLDLCRTNGIRVN